MSRVDGETIVGELTTTSYYTEYEHLPGEWRSWGARHDNLTSAKRAQPPGDRPARIKIHTRHILDVDTWITK